MAERDHVCTGAATCPLCNDEGNVLGEELFFGIKTEDKRGVPDIQPSENSTGGAVMNFNTEVKHDTQLVLKILEKIAEGQNPKKLIREVRKFKEWWEKFNKGIKNPMDRLKVKQHIIYLDDSLKKIALAKKSRK